MVMKPYSTLAGLALSGTLLLAAPGVLANGSGNSSGGSLPSQSMSRYDPAEDYKKGIEALKAEKFEDADRAFGRVLQVVPRDANSNLLAGMARAGLGNLKDARRFYEKAARLDDNLILAHRELGVAHAKLGETDKAKAVLDSLKQRAATCAGTCAQAADLKAAIPAIEAVLVAPPTSQAPPSAELLFTSAERGDHAYLEAVALINDKRYDEAITALNAAARAFGPHPDILTYLGFANRKLGRFDVAEDYYRQALATAPDHLGATEYFRRADGRTRRSRRRPADARQAGSCLSLRLCRGGRVAPMDSGRTTRRVLSRATLAGSVLVAAGVALGPAAAQPPLREARWLAPERQAHALAHEPTECLHAPADAQLARRIAIGRAAFRAPLLLGGQAARAGLSCNSCHRSGRGNPGFQFPGLSGAPGTADVTSSLMSSHRGDGVHNPVPIPDLSGPVHKVSRAVSDPALATFIRGLIVKEFDGPEPAALTLASLADYVRALSPRACPLAHEQRTRLANRLAHARGALQAAQFALDARDAATARLMLASARTELGTIDERYAAPSLADNRQRLRDADLELAAIQQTVDAGQPDAALRIAMWLADVPRWAEPLARDEPLSLFNAERLGLCNKAAPNCDPR
jgi:tetratricopeptide (TPR) repeat protein